MKVLAIARSHKVRQGITRPAAEADVGARIDGYFARPALGKGRPNNVIKLDGLDPQPEVFNALLNEL
jgi:hypothetical protein